jgi:hAT family C-terminal dimerisation region
MMPKLFTQVCSIFTQPSTSVASESLFSRAGQLQRKERMSLSSRNLRFTLFQQQEEYLKECAKYIK